MERGERRDVASGARIAQPFAAEPHDALADAENALGRGAAEQHQHLRLEQLDLPGEERRASLDLFWRRRAVAGRTPIDRVGDVEMRLVEPDRRQHTVEHLPGAADEGLALQILVAAWSLADQHEVGLLAAAREAEALSRALQSAAVELADQGLECGKSDRLGDASPVEGNRFGNSALGRGLARGGFSLAKLGGRRGKAVDRLVPDRLVDAQG